MGVAVMVAEWLWGRGKGKGRGEREGGAGGGGWRRRTAVAGGVGRRRLAVHVVDLDEWRTLLSSSHRDTGDKTGWQREESERKETRKNKGSVENRI
ncbi:hypothetical protein Droror1_Dr00012127 [Drosera rotundifolia]